MRPMPGRRAGPRPAKPIRRTTPHRAACGRVCPISTRCGCGNSTEQTRSCCSPTLLRCGLLAAECSDRCRLLPAWAPSMIGRPVRHRRGGGARRTLSASRPRTRPRKSLTRGLRPGSDPLFRVDRHGSPRARAPSSHEPRTTLGGSLPEDAGLVPHARHLYATEKARSASGAGAAWIIWPGIRTVPLPLAQPCARICAKGLR